MDTSGNFGRNDVCTLSWFYISSSEIKLPLWGVVTRRTCIYHSPAMRRSPLRAGVGAYSHHEILLSLLLHLLFAFVLLQERLVGPRRLEFFDRHLRSGYCTEPPEKMSTTLHLSLYDHLPSLISTSLIWARVVQLEDHVHLPV